MFGDIPAVDPTWTISPTTVHLQLYLPLYATDKCDKEQFDSSRISAKARGTSSLVDLGHCGLRTERHERSISQPPVAPVTRAAGKKLPSDTSNPWDTSVYTAPNNKNPTKYTVLISITILLCGNNQNENTHGLWRVEHVDCPHEA